MQDLIHLSNDDNPKSHASCELTVHDKNAIFAGLYLTIILVTLEFNIFKFIL